MDDSILPRFFLLVILLIVSAFFSASEVAFFSLNPFQLKEMKEKKGRFGKLVSSLLEKPRELLITIYIGNEFVNVAISVITTSIAIKLFGSLGVGIAIGVATFLLLVFGDIVPKSMSIKFAETFALTSAYPLKLFSNLVGPLQRLLTRITEKFLSSMGIGALHLKKSALTDDEFRTMVEVGKVEGVLEKEESEMIHKVIEFSETAVADIMTDKTDMFTVVEDENLDEIIPKIMKNFYSRVPVYDKDEEHIIGILFTKDLNHLKHLPMEKVNLKSILREPISVPQSKKVKELLEEFRKMKRHMAIVLDEFGSVAGLVTLEDILEELVGEIDSEMRMEEIPLVKIAANHYRLLGSYSLSEFGEHFHKDLPVDEYDTVGGMVFGLFGRVPRSGESISYDNFNFRVEKMKGPRILKLHLTILNPPSPGTGGDKKEKKTAQV